MDVKNKYRYELTDRVGTVEVFPLGEASFSIDYNRETEGKYFYSAQHKGKMKFRGEAFDRLRTLEQTIYICSPIRLKIFRDCGSGVLIFDGFINLLNADWNLDRCEVSVKYDKSTPDRCIELGKSERVDIMANINNRITVKTAQVGGGTFETKTYNDHVSHTNPTTQYGGYVWHGSADPYEQKWTPYKHEEMFSAVQPADPNDPSQQITGVYNATTSWVREIVVQDSALTAPSSWLLLEDNTATNGTKKYAKNATLINCASSQNNTDLYNYSINYECQILGASQTTGSTIDNGMRLRDVLTVLLTRLCPDLTIVSDFFQINPETPSAVNYVTGLETETAEIILFQKSDVKRPNASGNATRAQLSIDKLLEALTTMFNVAYSIKNGVFRLEHLSWYTRDAGLDLTAEPFRRFIAGKRAYSFDADKIPRLEKWLFKEQSAHKLDWRGEIVYNGDCASGGKKAEENHAVEDFMSDMELALNNPSPDSNIVEDAGMVIVATKKIGADYYVISKEENGFISLNNTLGWKRLVKNYHFHNRYLKTGLFNDEPATFLTTRPIKKGEKLIFPLCCDADFNPEDTILSNLGTAIVDSATYNFKNETLEIVPLYEVFNSVAGNVKPTISGGSFSLYAETSINIPLTTGDVDGTVTNIEVVNNPTNGTLVVNGLTSVDYTPNAGFTGYDFFHLRVYDNWSEPSDGAGFLVNVLPANTAPVAVNDNFNVYHGETFNSGNGILFNDSDDHGFTLITSTVTTTQGVSITLNPDGSFNYVPPANYEGLDSFSYTIEDNTGAQSTAVVTLNVQFKNKPIAVPDSYITKKNTTLSINGTVAGQRRLFANDYTPDGLLYSYTTNVENKATAQGGTVSITADGLFTYNPPVDFIGSDSFDYTVNNSNGSQVGTVTINVIPQIYVKLVRSNMTHENRTAMCGDPPVATAGGIAWRADFILKFYSDAAGTIPFNVSGTGFRVNIKEERSGAVNYVSIYETQELSGNQYLLLEDFYYYEDNVDCFGSNTVETDITIDPSPNYSII